MTKWTKRPIEIANLLNPAFCSLVIRDAIKGYNRINDEPCPYPLAFLVLPIVLHKQTRESLPKTTGTIMHSWLQENPEIRIGFAQRVRRINQFTKESILFGIAGNLLLLSGQGGLISTGRLKKLSWRPEDEVSAIRNKSLMLGSWFGNQTSVQSVFAFWGVTP